MASFLDTNLSRKMMKRYIFAFWLCRGSDVYISQMSSDGPPERGKASSSKPKKPAKRAPVVSPPKFAVSICPQVFRKELEF